MILDSQEEAIAWSHLTDSELRRLHRRFGHPSAQRLSKLLKRAGHEVELKAIKYLTRYCHQCQIHQKSPHRFKFTLKDDVEFNYMIEVDIFWIMNKEVLQVIDTATAFQAARFLKNMSAKTVWNTLKACWIDTYLGPPNYISHDAGKQFQAAEFKQNAKMVSSEVKEVPIEAHNSIGKNERYHQPLRRAFEILYEELKGQMDPENILQMAVKTVNDTAGPEGLVPTLLVFGAYPRMTDDSPPSPTISQRAEAIRKASKEVQRIHAERKVKEALAMRNGPDIKSFLELPLGSDVLVWREKDKWTGPFKLLAIDGQTCTVSIGGRGVNFRSTVVKPYYFQTENEKLDKSTALEGYESDNDSMREVADSIEEFEDPINIIDSPEMKQSRGPGRPKGSKNKTRNLLDNAENTCFFDEKDGPEQELETSLFLTSKEEDDIQLAIKMRKEKLITAPGKPFEASDKKEIDSLISNGVFQFVRFDRKIHGFNRIFGSRMVREIKGKGTNAPYEKSRLVIQGHNDTGKNAILTQSPTIQRVSQRLIVALAPTLLSHGIFLWLRDITQAYTQSATIMQRKIFARLPREIEQIYPPGTIMEVIKPLYGIAEAGTHWWATYYKHHLTKLSMVTSSYDPCLLITKSDDIFGIVGMQTDDTLILSDSKFSNLEEDELNKASFSAKPKQKLSVNQPLLFNGCVLTQHCGSNSISILQKEQGKKIQLIDAKSDNSSKSYIEQRARGAYIASICQPESTFDLSIAAQNQHPNEEDIVALNKRLSWQIKSLNRGLH